MELGEILSDAIVYPLHNIKALVIYLILGIILGIAVGGTILGLATGAAYDNALAALGAGVIGLIVSLILGFFISGYELDITKYGIEKREDAPGIDFVRQFINGVKLFITQIVYMLIPIIISAILAVIFQNWISQIIVFIVALIFSFALMMAQCRLAKTEDIMDALSFGEAIGDISRVGIVKILLFTILVFIVMFVLLFIVNLVTQWNSTVGGILLGIIGVYITFFTARAVGLLYSDV